MPWNGSNAIQFNRWSILANAPEVSGVYALFNNGVWIYIGESRNIRQRLLEHLTNEQNPCVVRSQPQFFAYEAVAAEYRVARQDRLIFELSPTCNMRLG
jgi:excinuclease UvrABC nuclease subunit